MLFTNTDLKTFAESHINVKKEKVDEYREQVNRLRDKLADYIKDNPEYGLVKMLHSGSVRKGTALKTLNDMDVAVYVKPEAVDENDESNILEYVRQALVEIYTKHNMKPEQFTIGHHCVKVSFKGSGLDVDVVPVIPNGEADDRGYLITRDTGERVLTSIPLHLEFIRKRKSANTNFAQMVRITKWWRDQRDFKFKSFLIELIWAHIADTEGIADEIVPALKQFFRYIIKTELKSNIIFEDNYKKSKVTLSSTGANIFDPVNPENNVGQSLDDEKRMRIVDEADDALGYLTHAEQASTKGVAISSLKQIFGTSFSF
ncbi:CBASS oligonucleotide cyclase [Paenibacillus flagellatus]|uniref:Nucleotidyltransferase n=1 Tax=Paenibacillus flagellatus TaxID=2211139 RepID=A0A2V5KIF0_9BACL|nr:CBASS oligonucleotide cyclase [Paenibacillus flagellatus]PYI50007.1 nucleotidyltransferase [Paenibacillus flagellatus]